jgi:hypothetical protein
MGIISKKKVNTRKFLQVYVKITSQDVGYIFVLIGSGRQKVKKKSGCWCWE